MRAQAIAIFLTVVVSLIGVSYYQVGEGVSSDAKALGEGAARSQIAALIPAFLSEFKIINEQFDTVAPKVLGVPTDFNDTVSNRFEMVARLQLVNGNWNIVQRAFHEKTRVKAWADNYTQIALKGLKPRDIPLGGTALTALLDPQRRPFFLWIMRDERDQWASVITKTDVFQAIIDRQRGQNSAIFLVNKTGQALGHTTAEYVGTILKDDPIVADILRANKAQGVGTFRTNSGVDVQGLYEQVPGSNTYVVLSRPLTALNDRISSLRLQILLMGGGLALVGLAVMMLTLKSGAQMRPGGPPNLGISTSAGAMAPVTAAAPAAPVSASSASDLAREKMKAYTTSASALAREMHGPLTRILSQTQILKAKSVNLEEVTRIEELARDGRNVVLKLLSFAGEEEFKAEPTSINEVLNRTLGVFENRFQMKGIKVDKNFKRMPEVTANPLALMKVLEALFNNSIEAMERMPKKELKLSLEAEGADVVLKIQDSGEGITGDKAGQVFDPFFTTKNPSQHSGLGLSTAYGLVREFGGDLQFTSVPGQGAQIVLRFPVGASSLPLADAPAPTPVSSNPRGLPNLDDLPPSKPLPSTSFPTPSGFPSVAAPSGPPISAPPMAAPAAVASAVPAGTAVPSGLSAFMKNPEPTAPQPVAPQPAAPTAPTAPAMSAPTSAPPTSAPPTAAPNFATPSMNLPPNPTASAPLPSTPAPQAPAPMSAPTTAPAARANPTTTQGFDFNPASLNLPPSPMATQTGQTPGQTSQAPSAQNPAGSPSTLRSVPMPAAPTGAAPAPGMAVAQRPPAQAPLPPRVSAEPPAAQGLRSVKGAAPTVTVTPGVPLGDGMSLEMTGELALEKTNGSANSPSNSASSQSVIQDRAIEETMSLIDQIENGPLTPVGGAPTPAAPAQQQIEVRENTQTGTRPPTGNPESTAFGKIDKPNFGPKKPAPKVAGASVAIRKPGERK